MFTFRSFDWHQLKYYTDSSFQDAMQRVRCAAILAQNNNVILLRHSMSSWKRSKARNEKERAEEIIR